MIDNESSAENQRKDEREFLSELAKLVCDYRTQIPFGHLIGALEIVKMRLYHEANVNIMEGGKEDK